MGVGDWGVCVCWWLLFGGGLGGMGDWGVCVCVLLAFFGGVVKIGDLGVCVCVLLAVFWGGGFGRDGGWATQPRPSLSPSSLFSLNAPPK